MTQPGRGPGDRCIAQRRDRGGGAGLSIALALAASAAHGAELTPTADAAIDALSPVSTASADRSTSNGAIALSDVEPGRAAGDGRLVGAVVHLHIVDDGLRRSIGGQSSRMVVDMDCRSGWFRSRDMTVWSGPYESGEARPLRTNAEWTAAGGGAYLTQLTRTVCAQAGLDVEPPAHPAAVPAADAAPTPDPAPAPAPAPPRCCCCPAWRAAASARRSETRTATAPASLASASPAGSLSRLESTLSSVWTSGGLAASAAWGGGWGWGWGSRSRRTPG